MSKPITYTFITGETSKIYSAHNLEPPITINWTSSDATRKIEISTDNGATYDEVDYDATTSASKQVLTLNARISSFKVTGVAGDSLIVS